MTLGNKSIFESLTNGKKRIKMDAEGTIIEKGALILMKDRTLHLKDKAGYLIAAVEME